MLSSPTPLRVIALAAVFTTTLAACSRSALQSASDNFFSSAFSKGSFAIAPNAKITQDNKLYKNLDETIHGNMMNFARPLQISALDVDTCNVGTYAIPTEGTADKNEIAMASVRLNLNDNSNQVEEVEILNILRSSFILFAPRMLPEKPSAMWKQAQNSSRSLSRADLLDILDSYPTGIQAGEGAIAKVATDCVRYENGFRMPIKCNDLFAAFKWPVTNRRWYIDTQTGTALGAFYFDNAAKFEMGIPGLWLHEYMKVEDGAIKEIIAGMISWPGNFTDAWKGNV
ncbi:hypothetical protein K402DRAFT_420441 [Aulographum hederae CBS 113979]|uniref:DUF8021 domain-containing protein n=1 Tax=Aulographum hederae CBS 113979 TaxID=1176131 RepID=A0A6G1H1W2_9PEZI|nr:hypothetical protein K402DRAFT_420441 [Aulographum hederae CBS 113979]